MERELWPPLYRLLQEVGAAVRQKDVTYQPAVIVAVLLWAALHDRPMGWACDERNWNTRVRPVALPSPPTMSRRLGDIAVAVILRALEDRLRESRPPGLVLIIDGKPLTVGGLSHDPDAGYGHGAGKLAKGYKLDAIWAGRPMPESWAIAPPNVTEAREAPALIDRVRSEGYLLGDNQYDSSALYDAAAARGLRLIAARKDPEAGISPGHYQSPHRLSAIDLMKRPFGQEVFALRGRIEADFGNATSFAGGLAPLPAWVRRSHRVLRWTWAKLLINGIRITEKYRLTA
jgi:hypothetical protein